MPISGIIEISADIGVNIRIYRYRRIYADIGVWQESRWRGVQVPPDGSGDGGAGCKRDRLLDEDDKLVGRVKDVKEVEKRLRQSQRHRLLPRNAWRLIPFFELFMSCPKDELHQWYVHLSQVLIDIYSSIQKICCDVLGMY
jgi:hypothetical protein